MFEDITSDGFSGKNPSKGRRSAHCAKEGEHSTVDLYLISCRCPKGQLPQYSHMSQPATGGRRGTWQRELRPGRAPCSRGSCLTDNQVKTNLL